MSGTRRPRVGAKRRSTRGSKGQARAHIAVIHGPNLNLLGTREPGIYGTTKLEDIDARLEKVGHELGAVVSSFQSNHEGELVDYVHGLIGGCTGILINAAGFTHTSVVLRDALLATKVPFVEVHLSNVHARESFRHVSMLADAAKGVISGFGPLSYELGLRALLEI